MSTLQQIRNNPKCNVWGSLGSRNRVPVLVSVLFELGQIWAITSNEAIYSNDNFNYSIYLDKLPESILSEINNQLL